MTIERGRRRREEEEEGRRREEEEEEGERISPCLAGHVYTDKVS